MEKKETVTEQVKVIAVSFSEFQEFGCPYCGYRSGHAPISSCGAAVWKCGSNDCEKSCIILLRGTNQSTIGFKSKGEIVYPKLQEHPFKGKAAHGNVDKKPEGGGEFFHSRGIGNDFTPGCFICGGEHGFHDNISAFVQCKEAGERVVSMFKKGLTRLDYRKSEPDRVQVKIGACEKHGPNLVYLNELVAPGIVTEEIIKKAISM